MQLARIVYVSESVRVFERHEIDAIAAEARSFNQLRKITGLLVHNGGHFVQILEGPPLEVVTLFERIKLDMRHKRVEQLLFTHVKKRMFWHWAMGLIDASRPGQLDRDQLRSLAQLHDQLRVIDADAAVLGLLKIAARKLPALRLAV